MLSLPVAPCEPIVLPDPRRHRTTTAMAQDSGDLAKRMKPLTIEDNGAQPIDQAPPPRGREVSSAARTLPPGLDNQARMFYWKIEDVSMPQVSA